MFFRLHYALVLSCEVSGTCLLPLKPWARAFSDSHFHQVLQHVRGVGLYDVDYRIWTLPNSPQNVILNCHSRRWPGAGNDAGHFEPTSGCNVWWASGCNLGSPSCLPPAPQSSPVRLQQYRFIDFPSVVSSLRCVRDVNAYVPPSFDESAPELFLWDRIPADGIRGIWADLEEGASITAFLFALLVTMSSL